MSVTDQSIEKVVSTVLRTGVLISGLIVLVGGVYLLAEHGSELVDYHKFEGQTLSIRDIGKIVHSALHGQGQSVVELGVLCLIATPIIRVIVSLIGFALERDRTYALITSLVLAILLYSLISGAAGGG